MVPLIDFGNDRTKAAFWGKSGPVAVKAPSGENYWPSYVYLGEDGKVIFGEDARQLGLCQPDRVAYGFKSFLGDKAKKYFGGTKTAVEILAMAIPIVIAHIQLEARTAVDGVVATMPATFDESKKQAILDAYGLAGIKVLQLLHEPAAAALGYAVSDAAGQGRTSTYVVVDVGHGTTDVCVMEIRDGVAKSVSIEGLPKLGGRDFSTILSNLVFEEASKIAGKTITFDKLSAAHQAEVHEKIERGKHSLSGQPSVKIALNLGGKAQLIEIQQAKYEGQCAPIYEKLKDCTEKAMKVAGLGWKDVNRVAAVGAPFRNPRLVDFVATFTGHVPATDIDPALSVALGGAIHAHAQALKEAGIKGPVASVELKQGTYHDVGICMIDNSSGTKRTICWKMVGKNQEVPHAFTDTFKLENPEQTEVVIEVLQGVHGADSKNCLCIGKLKLSGMPPERFTTSRIEITFQFDHSTMVKITARDKISGITNSVDISLTEKKAA